MTHPRVPELGLEPRVRFIPGRLGERRELPSTCCVPRLQLRLYEHTWWGQGTGAVGAPPTTTRALRLSAMATGRDRNPCSHLNLLCFGFMLQA